MAPGDLSREQLVRIVDQLLRCDPADEEEQDRLLHLFQASVLHPRASTLIFFPEQELGPEYQGRTLTAEEIVDRALDYKPIRLGPASE